MLPRKRRKPRLRCLRRGCRHTIGVLDVVGGRTALRLAGGGVVLDGLVACSVCGEARRFVSVEVDSFEA